MLDREQHDAEGHSLGTLRATLEEKARRGDAKAAQDMAGPPYPEALAYLDDWSRELYGRSGVSMSGVLPVSYREIESWARLTGRIVRPYEVDALVTLDAVRRNPETPSDG